LFSQQHPDNVLAIGGKPDEDADLILGKSPNTHLSVDVFLDLEQHIEDSIRTAFDIGAEIDGV
jgi:hypothetical protein